MAITTHISIGDPGIVSQITRQAVEEIIGSGFQRKLQIPNKPTAYNTIDRTSINQLLIDTYGDESSYGLALRIGRALFARLLRTQDSLTTLGEIQFRVLPLSKKLIMGLPVVAQAFGEISGQHGTMIDRGTKIHYAVKECPDCTKAQNTAEPICYVTIGMIKEALYWLSGSREFDVYESECFGMGHECCRFIIDKTPR